MTAFIKNIFSMRKSTHLVSLTTKKAEHGDEQRTKRSKDKVELMSTITDSPFTMLQQDSEDFAYIASTNSAHGRSSPIATSPIPNIAASRTQILLLQL
jgi:hypothetical protein